MARKLTRQQVQKSLWYSILDGSFYSAMVGFGESFFSAFAIFLQATNIQIALVGSLPQALGSVSQLFSNKVLRHFNSRKKVVCIGALLEAMMYIPIALVFFLGTFRVAHLIIFISIYWIFGMIINPAWNSWMGDLVVENERGSYFGRRNRIAGLVSFATLLLGGYMLQHFADGTATQYIGFALIFVLALLCRVLSFWALSKKFEPSFRMTHDADFTFIDFIRQARFHNYGLYTFYLSLMNFAVFVAGPFFTAYMLNDLRMDYLTFTIVNATSLLVKYLAMPIWGRASDRYGTRKVLSLSGYLMPLVPLLWLVSGKVWYLLVIQVYSGFVWAGFELASFNFVFDTTSPQKRTTCIAYLNVLNGIAIFGGAMVGGLLVKYNQIFWSKYMLVFVASAVLRYAASFIFIPKLKEVRIVEKVPYHELLLRVLTTMPTMGLVHTMITIREHVATKIVHPLRPHLHRLIPFAGLKGKNRRRKKKD